MGERIVNISEDEINHDKREKKKKRVVLLFEKNRIRFIEVHKTKTYFTSKSKGEIRNNILPKEARDIYLFIFCILTLFL